MSLAPDDENGGMSGAVVTLVVVIFLVLAGIIAYRFFFGVMAAPDESGSTVALATMPLLICSHSV